MCKLSFLYVWGCFLSTMSWFTYEVLYQWFLRKKSALLEDPGGKAILRLHPPKNKTVNLENPVGRDLV